VRGWGVIQASENLHKFRRPQLQQVACTNKRVLATYRVNPIRGGWASSVRRWPSDLFVPAGDCMERRETTASHSPFVLSGLPNQVGGRVGWLMTGIGCAYLAWCPEKGFLPSGPRSSPIYVIHETLQKRGA